MKNGILPTVTLAMLTAASQADARDNCDVSMERWKPRSAVQEFASQQGWRVKRIKIDDGCYEVYGKDSAGHKFEAVLNPETLEILRLRKRDQTR